MPDVKTPGTREFIHALLRGEDNSLLTDERINAKMFIRKLRETANEISDYRRLNPSFPVARSEGLLRGAATYLENDLYDQLSRDFSLAIK